MSKTIVITGGSDGIGAAAAIELSRRGHRMVIVGRSPEKSAAVAARAGADYFVADFAVLAQVRQLAVDLAARYERIDVLANNAGGIFGDREKTVDGHERTFQINHLAPFLLTRLLMDTLIASRASIIQTSSLGARLVGHLDLDDIEHDRNFSATRAYGTAKLENILFTRELDRRYGQLGVAAAAFHPGTVATSFAGNSSSFLRRVYGSRIMRMFMTSAEKGAGQLVWLAEGVPGSDWTSGAYYENYKIARKHNPQVFDDELAATLWERSEQLISCS